MTTTMMDHSFWQQRLLVALCWTLGLGVWCGAISQSHAASSARLKAALVQIKTLYGNQRWSNVVAEAQQAVQSPKASSYSEQYALLYIYMGAAFFQLKQRALAYHAFEKALIWQPRSMLPAGSSQRMQKLLADTRKHLANQGLGQAVKKDSSTTTPSKAPEAKGGAHVGVILGWVSVALAGAAIGMAGVAGGNAYINAQEAATLLRQARQQKYSQTLMDPIITSVHDRAVTYGTVANVGYIVAGTAALGATGFFLWAFLSNKKKPSNASLPKPHTSVQLSSISLQFQ